MCKTKKCVDCQRVLPLEDFFSVDHDHKIGAIRGLLCDKCNRALGFLQEDEETLLKAAEYLHTHKI